ncbi:MAG: ABC transporter ATP-binding protein [Deltaproteobacteria bacterium]|nr:ABC transporter ATP-binding protein [Deltaproteobacteria bacterium]
MKHDGFPLLKLEQVSKNFGGLRAVDQVDLSLESGERRAIIGPNGAGKTTLFNLITRRFPSDSGRILFKGRAIDRLPPYQIWRLGISRTFQVTSIFPRLSCVENVQRIGAVLSHGDRKCLELAVALASEPELLLLDEPTAGMAPKERFALIALIQRLAQERGLTLLFTEHDMDVVFAAAQRITVMHQGAVLAEGTPPEVRGNPEVQRVYLGWQRG